MRFIHAADIHLDSPLTGLSAYEDAPVQRLRTATREAFTRLVNVAIDEAVDFMVIAGDLYDGDWKDHNTGLYFVAQMGRLNRADIPVYLLYGNHDAESQMTRKLMLPDNVHLFGSGKAATFINDTLKLAVHGRSFKVAATTDNLAASYPPPVPGLFNIGVLHTALEGNAAHANYAPCSLAELQAKGYQYWALGHVHEYSAWRGDACVVFPGNLQGRNIRETGSRGAVMVEVDDEGQIEVERLLVDVLRWHRLDVDVSACVSFAEVVRAIAAAMQALLTEFDADMPLAVRVMVNGATPAHGELFGLEGQLRAEVLAQTMALGHDRLWLEKVKLATRAPMESAAHHDNAEALADLRVLLDQAKGDPVFLESLQNDLMGLVGKAPQALQGSVPWFDDIRASDLNRLLDEVGPALMAHISKAE
ncbi:metallophosphoesterase family protein [Pollutimonas harenae]|uniref:DNA repair exonuclease n=1 Tax=Pollutimonas harenae TaxID=657015 RepID=A0A853H1P2_9BURK|nr:DNA repair exonuclease [Pollutimonas harenae]NYT86212.1 DNA repair exonuclease [Pollutimonas harenae]TEA71244.1 DNA repair exonuclease [Pollutimonas harenae]